MAISPIREAKRQWLAAVVDRFGGNQRDVAARLDIPYTNFNSMVRGGRAVSDDTIDHIHRTLAVPLPFIGEPTAKNLAADPSVGYGLPRAVTVDQVGNENIVVVEAKAKAGYVNGMGDPEYLKRLPAYRLPYLPMGTFRDFTVDGFSMYNPDTGQIMQGSHVIARSVGLAGVRAARVHVIVTDQDVLIKRTYPEDGMWRLRSDNPDKIAYPDIELPAEVIREVWYVEQLLTASIPPRSATDEMEEMRGELDLLRKAINTLQGKNPTP